MKKKISIIILIIMIVLVLCSTFYLGSIYGKSTYEKRLDIQYWSFQVDTQNYMVWFETTNNYVYGILFDDWFRYYYPEYEFQQFTFQESDVS